jgi:Sec-independent protein translocase protein TatA
VILLNFSHLLTPDHLAELATQTGQAVEQLRSEFRQVQAEAGYRTSDQIVELVREVKRELANERAERGQQGLPDGPFLGGFARGDGRALPADRQAGVQPRPRRLKWNGLGITPCRIHRFLLY